jgi:hypothetical protein
MINELDRMEPTKDYYAAWDEWRFADGYWTATHTIYNGEKYTAHVSHTEEHDGFVWKLLFNGEQIACGEDSSAEDGRQSTLAALMMAMKLRKPLDQNVKRIAAL